MVTGIAFEISSDNTHSVLIMFYCVITHYSALNVSMQSTDIQGVAK